MKYEVIKLKTGQELCGMVSYTDSTVSITLPMICQLTRVSQANTLATFIPYAPLANDPILIIGLESIMHTSVMNKQFIPFYDEASAKWLSMVEDGNIPLTNAIPSPKQFLKERIEGMMEGITDEEFDAWDEADDASEEETQMMEDYMRAFNASGKKIIH